MSVKHIIEDKNLCYFCGKKVEENQPRGEIRVEINNIDAIIIKNYPICFDCVKILNKDKREAVEG